MKNPKGEAFCLLFCDTLQLKFIAIVEATLVEKVQGSITIQRKDTGNPVF